MNTILLILLLLTSKCESQEIEENYWSSNTTDESSESLFEVTGYPMTGDVPILNRKIFKGTRVNIREHPYIVSIRRLYSHYLTGTLITKNLILTVAHPLYGVPVNELRVVMGENYADRGTILLTVILVIIHQDFDKYTLVGDLAIIRFYEDIIFKSNVKSISLVAPYVNIVNSTAFVTGWGRCDLTGKELCLPRGSQYYPGEMLDPMLRTISLTITSPNYYCQGYRKCPGPR
ncbi:trypsin epsilon-like isoform X2 [Danaus plexippus]|uniref:trypsin epsilon-like isoform X2 n=1 Tax=Danaus plexippus TaxID=13037 RepID=UPI002AB138AC|nr:trypsin epsilon-like isoform X2 [Danaus plexippus]